MLTTWIINIKSVDTIRVSWKSCLIVGKGESLVLQCKLHDYLFYSCLMHVWLSLSQTPILEVFYLIELVSSVSCVFVEICIRLRTVTARFRPNWSTSTTDIRSTEIAVVSVSASLLDIVEIYSTKTRISSTSSCLLEIDQLQRLLLARIRLCLTFCRLTLVEVEYPWSRPLSVRFYSCLGSADTLPRGSILTSRCSIRRRSCNYLQGTESGLLYFIYVLNCKSRFPPTTGLRHFLHLLGNEVLSSPGEPTYNGGMVSYIMWHGE